VTLVLSLFPGIGLLDHAFELEGYCAVRGPDVIWGGDIRRFHPPARVFAGVIGGPPCQMFSSLANLVRANGHEPKFGNLIPEFERCVAEAAPDWFLMENVPAAPVSAIAGYDACSFLLDNSALLGEDGFGLEQRRIRRITFGMRGQKAPCLLKWIDLAVFLLPDAERTTTEYGGIEWPLTDAEAGRSRSGHETAAHDSMENVTEWSKQHKYRQRSVVSHLSDTPVKIGGSGKVKRQCRQPAVTRTEGGGRYRLADALRLQGLERGFLDHCPFTAEGKLKAVANGVPIQMGRALARAIKEATCPVQPSV
jgi:DNA (cytosine-5)-methyltransferase 1